jgi:hypothetical protein
VNTSEYGKRVIALFESGRATKAQKAEMVEALLCAFERGLCNVAAIHKAIGFDAAQAAEEAEVEERYTRATAVLA